VADIEEEEEKKSWSRRRRRRWRRAVVLSSGLLFDISFRRTIRVLYNNTKCPRERF
jgi:hypothetical protein